MYTKDLFSPCFWSPVIFGWIYQTCLFRDFWSRPWLQEAQFRILVLFLSWCSAHWGCDNMQPLGRLCLWRTALEWGLSGALAYCKCSSHNVHLQLGSSTSNPKHDIAQTSSCFLLTAVSGCEDFQLGRPGTERMVGQCSWSGLYGSHHAPWEVVASLEGATQTLVLEGTGVRKEWHGSALCTRTSNCLVAQSVLDMGGVGGQICTGLSCCSEFAGRRNTVKAAMKMEL